MRKFEAQVAAGLALIGDKESKIDLDTLNLFDRYNCVLGQIYGDYGVGFVLLMTELGFPSTSPFGNTASQYGFMRNIEERVDNIFAEWEELTNEWKLQISAKRRLTPAAE